MKQYEFIQMKYKAMKGGYVTSKDDGYRDHRTVINDMAEQGWRFVGNLPVNNPSMESHPTVYDLVFEMDDE